MEKILYVEWSDRESAGYYIGKGMKAKKTPGRERYTLESFSGTYIFDMETPHIVLLETGVEVRTVQVKHWEVK